MKITRVPKCVHIGLCLFILIPGWQSRGNAQSQPAPRHIANEQQKALVRSWIERGFNRGDVNVVDEVFAETVAINGRAMRREDLKRNMRRRLAAFPDLHVTIDEVIGEGDLVGIWYTARGTQKGEFEGVAPTDRQVSWIGADVFRIENGKIGHARFVDDTLGLMRQLGASLMPPTGHSPR